MNYTNFSPLERNSEQDINDFSELLCDAEVFKRLQHLLLVEGVPSGIDNKILNYLTKIPSWLARLVTLPYPQYQFSAVLEQWLIAYQKYPLALDHRLVQTCNHPCAFAFPAINGLLCIFLVKLHHRLTSSQYRYKNYYDSIESNKNYDECINYINGLFDCYSKLVVLRMDLSYRKEIVESKTFEDLRNDIDKMRNNARHNEKLFKGLEGYIFKIEYGLDKRIHAHVLLFFNGHIRKPSSDVYHASQIKAYWENVITQGDGFVWNCNDHKEQYRYNGIGLVNANDVEKRDYLIMAMKYLCKKDRQVIKPRDKPQTKTLTKGDLRNHNPNLGRPRVLCNK